MKNTALILLVLALTAGLFGGSISGQANCQGSPNHNAIVVLMNEGFENIAETPVTEGLYEFTDLFAGTYFVAILGCNSILFYENAHFPEDATPIVLETNESVVTDINFGGDVNPPEYPVMITGHVMGVQPNIQATVLLYNELPVEGILPVLTTELESGHYAFHDISYGTYYLKIEGEEFEAEYYEDTTIAEEATPVTVSEEQPVQMHINFNLSGDEEPCEFGTISGTITGLPQYIMADILAFSEIPGEDTQPAGFGHLMPNGSYVIHHLEYGTYYVAVIVMGSEPIFYENTTNPEEATLVTVSEENPEINGIDFDLTGVTPGDYGMISGMVMTPGPGHGNNEELEGVIQLFNELPLEGVEPYASYELEWRHYEFNNLPWGTYYVKLITEDQVIYYDMTETAENATPVILNEEFPFAYSIDFILNEIPQGNNSVYGLITDSDGNVVADAEVILFSEDHWHNPLFTISNQDGSYLFESIPDGSYYLAVFSGMTHMPYFYENAYNWEDATLIVLENETAMEINPVLTIPETFTVTGTVLDIEGLPVAEVSVHAMPNHGDHGNHGNHGGGRPMEFSAITDENGNFTLDLISGDYIFLAEICGENEFVYQFYNHKYNIFEADVVTVDADISGIDFELGAAEIFNNSISGAVTVENSLPEYPVWIVAMNQHHTSMASVDEEGNYLISDLPQGNYYVMAVSDFYAPVFYPGVVSFDEAVPVFVEGDITDINFNLAPVEGSGVYTVTGIVTDNSGIAVSNAYVTVLNQEGAVINYSRTNNEGYYEVYNVDNGDMSVVATKAYYSSETAEIVVDNNTQLNLLLTPVTVEANDENETALASGSIRVYPNPFNPVTNISYNVPSDGLVKVEIFNVKGQRVTTLRNEIQAAGTYSVIWNGTDSRNSSVSSGTYLCRITSSGKTNTQKMLLMK